MDKDDEFESLLDEIDSWVEEPFDALPITLQARISAAFILDWDKLDVEQRRLVAEQWDVQHGPDTKYRMFWWKYGCREQEIEEEIRKWNLVDTPTASDLEIQKRNIKALEDELEEWKAEAKRMDDEYLALSDGSDQKPQQSTTLEPEPDPILARQTLYWRKLEEAADRVLQAFPSWQESQRTVQNYGNLMEWLVQDHKLATREADIVKKVLTDAYPELVKKQQVKK